MIKKWIVPLCIIIFPIGLLISLAARLEIEIGWATAPITLTGLFLYYETASFFSDHSDFIKWQLGTTDNQKLLKFIALVYVCIIGSYTLNSIRGENVTLTSSVFVTISLSFYILVYAVSMRHLESINISADEVGDTVN